MVERINVPHMFHDPRVKVCLPINIRIDDSTVVFSLLIQLGPQYLILENSLTIYMLIKIFLQGNFILICNCDNSDVMDKNHQHIAAGD